MSLSLFIIYMSHTRTLFLPLPLYVSLLHCLACSACREQSESIPGPSNGVSVSNISKRGSTREFSETVKSSGEGSVS